jgi:hypothetical protein
MENQSIFFMIIMGAAFSFACLTLTPAATDIPVPPPEVSVLPEIERDPEIVRTKILEVLGSIQSLKWSGSGLDSKDGPFTVAGREGAGRYYTIDTFEDGSTYEYFFAEGTACDRNTQGQLMCYPSEIYSILDGLVKNVNGSLVIPEYTVTDSGFAFETFKGEEYAMYHQTVSQDSSQSTYFVKDYFDLNTHYPAYTVYEWKYPDLEMKIEIEYSDFNGSIDPIELPSH